MKKWLILVALGWLNLNLAFSEVFAQGVPADTLYEVPLVKDALPAITMKFEPAYLILFLVVPAGSLFIGAHSYQIQGDKVANPARLKPYFVATHDPQLEHYYHTHTQNRKIWYVATSTGMALWLVGFVQGINSLFDSRPSRGAGTMIFLGSAGIIGGQVARVISFQNLRKAVNLYNHQYAGPNPVVSLHLGLPSATPAGMGLYIKF